MPEAGTKTRSSSRKSIGFALGSVLGCLDGEIGVFIVAAFEMLFTQLTWHNWNCRHFGARAFDAMRFSRETSAPLLPPLQSPQFVLFPSFSALVFVNAR